MQVRAGEGERKELEEKESLIKALFQNINNYK